MSTPLAPLAIAVATQVILAVLSLLASVVMVIRRLIKPSDSSAMRIGSVFAAVVLALAGISLVLILVVRTDDHGAGEPSGGLYRSKVGEVCDGLNAAGQRYARGRAEADPYDVIGAWKIYEAREADFRELRPPAKAADMHAEASEIAKRHAAVVESATNDILSAKTAGGRRSALRSDEAGLRPLERDLAADLRKLGRSECRLTTFGRG